MSAPKIPSALEAATERLRALILSVEEGVLLGGEDALVAALGVSRATMRQAARVLEREGLLRVRRGVAGGYFAARPDLAAIEATVSAYLETLDLDAEDTTVVASVLWVEVARKAAALGTEPARALAERFRARVSALSPDAPFAQVIALEQDCRAAVFELVKAGYIELIFRINAAFAQRSAIARPSEADASEAHRAFIKAWRSAKLLELDAIADGDPDLAAMAARHVRNLWHRRVWRGADL